MKPEFDQWAEALIEEIYYTPEHLRVSLVENHLLKAVQRGYLDGMENSWHTEREKCSHRFIGLDTCDKCGVVIR